MSREILFRAKSIGNKEWIKDGEWVEGLPMYTANKFEKGKIDRILTLRDGYYSILLGNPETVCQYTGLTDKNGRKIFEGDIVKDSSCDLYTVNWSDENGMYEVRQYNCSMENFETFFACDCEVIGNIFDNTELLKEG